jgi:hypothetical protein
VISMMASGPPPPITVSSPGGLPAVDLHSFCFFFAVLGFELRAFTLSHSTSPFVVVCLVGWLVGFFEIGSY